MPADRRRKPRRTEPIHVVRHGSRNTGDNAAGFEHPLVSRYATPEMLAIWSPRTRIETWRRIWVALAESQRELGLPITQRQIAAMKRAVKRIDFDAAARYERELRHDVMAHIHAFADAAPPARGVIHLGATSMDVVDNADLLITRQALDLLIARLVAAARPLTDFCERYADMPTLGFTHLQPAQPTTVGKRAALWLADLLEDIRCLSRIRSELRGRGLRGATGTQASFLRLLGSAAKVRRLERRFIQKLGFDACYPISGQTVSRKTDVEVINTLASFACGVQKICNDIRILAMRKEIEEPFEKRQVGSSAMPYKRNPMRCERATGLARYLISLASSPLMTAGDQMLERTLDDSSNKRIVFPEAFLTADAVVTILHNVFDGLVVYPATIAANLEAELPFIASEDILMAAAARGGNRQELHERIRRHALAAGRRVKQCGEENDLVERLRSDAAFAGLDLSDILDPRRYVGLAPQQTREFVRRFARPLLAKLDAAEVGRSALRV